MLKVRNESISTETFLLAGILDRLSILLWRQTEDGAKGINRPLMVADILTEKEVVESKFGFATGEEFEAYRQSFLESEV